MTKTLLAAGIATLLASGAALAGSQPTLPGLSAPITSIIVIPQIGGSASGGGTPVFFVVTPPATPGGSFTFQLSRD
jgi:hypothetical protein